MKVYYNEIDGDCVAALHELMARDLFRLIRGRRPAVAMGEQVSGAAGYGWIDGVRFDLATYLGRADIQIVGIDWIKHDRHLGKIIVDLVIDHAADLPNREQEIFCVMGGRR